MTCGVQGNEFPWEPCGVQGNEFPWNHVAYRAMSFHGSPSLECINFQRVEWCKFLWEPAVYTAINFHGSHVHVV